MSNIVYVNIESICPYVRSAKLSKGIRWSGKFRKIYDYQMMFFLKGKGRYLVDGKQYDINPGTILFIKPDHKHTIHVDGEIEYIWVHFDFFYREDVKKFHEYIYNRKFEVFEEDLKHSEWIREEVIFKEEIFMPECIDLKDREVIEKLFGKLIFECEKKHIYYQLECKELLLQIIREIVYQIVASDYLIIQNNRYKILLRVYHFIEQNYYKNLTMGDIAKQVGLSCNHISKLMKMETGYPLMKYLNHYRIQKARELLMYDDLEVKDISKMVGFDDSHYFSRIFIKYEGVSPNNFRKMVNNR